MAALSTRIRSESLVETEVGGLLEAVNNNLYSLISGEGFFATILLTRYWPVSGKLEIVRAGHLPPIWITKAGDALPDLKGISLGVNLDVHYEKKQLVLSPGDSILLISDGVIEAENEENDLFGHDRVMGCLDKTSATPRGQVLLEEIQHWRGQAAVNDDVTILEIWRDPS
jgi:sigma-B regulation protein RsbU (phosphoserine phosphatase)